MIDAPRRHSFCNCNTTIPEKDHNMISLHNFHPVRSLILGMQALIGDMSATNTRASDARVDTLPVSLIPGNDSAVRVLVVDAYRSRGTIHVRAKLAGTNPTDAMTARCFRVSIVDDSGKVRMSRFRLINPSHIRPRESRVHWVSVKFSTQPARGEHLLISIDRTPET